MLCLLKALCTFVLWSGVGKIFFCLLGRERKNTRFLCSDTRWSGRSLGFGKAVFGQPGKGQSHSMHVQSSVQAGLGPTAIVVENYLVHMLLASPIGVELWTSAVALN